MRKRIIEMDMARGIATLAVMTIHISAVTLIDLCGDGNVPVISLLLNLGARFAVPTFILLSGMGLELSYKPEVGYWAYMKHRMSKIAPVYILWSVIYSLFYDDNSGTFMIKHSLKFRNIVFDLFTGNGCYHLYFIPLIVLLYLMFPLIRNTIKSWPGFIISSLVSAGLIILDNYVKLPEACEFVFDYRDPLRWMVYFSIGVWLAKNYTKIVFKTRLLKSAVVGAFFLCILWMTAVVYPIAKTANDVDSAIEMATPILLIYSILFIVCVWNIRWNNPVLRGFLGKISKYSYGIYLSHAMFLSLCIAAYHKSNVQVYELLFYILVMCIVLPLSYVLSLVINNLIYKKV